MQGLVVFRQVESVHEAIYAHRGSIDSSLGTFDRAFVIFLILRH